MQPTFKDLKLIACDGNPDRRESLKQFFKLLGAPKVDVEEDFRHLDGEGYDGIIVGPTPHRACLDEALDQLKIRPRTQKLPIFTWKNLGDEGEWKLQLSHKPDLSEKQAGTVTLLKNLVAIEQERLTAILKDCSFFSNFSYQELQQISSQSLVRHMTTGDNNISNDIQRGNSSIFVVLSGSIDIIIAQASATLRIPVRAGQPLGEVTYLIGSSSGVQTTVREDCFLLELGPETLSFSSTEVKYNILLSCAQSLATRLEKMNMLVQKEILVVSSARKTKGLPDPKPKEEAPKESAQLTETRDESLEVEKPSLKSLPEGTDGKLVAVAEEYDDRCSSVEKYEVLENKVTQRVEFFGSKIPKEIKDFIARRLHGYWSGAKLARHNPHYVFSEKSFIPGHFKLKDSLHLVVMSETGLEAFDDCFLELPFSHQVVGVPKCGCRGTFLGDQNMIARYLEGNCLKRALWHDLEMVIDRTRKGKQYFDLITHSTQDIQDESVFLIFDNKFGPITRKVRQLFPNNQIITVIPGYSFTENDLPSLFIEPETMLQRAGLLHNQPEQAKSGYYVGETCFLADLSEFLPEGMNQPYAAQFATIAAVANVGPDFSGGIWGSRGGAQGAYKAARALFGLKGPQTSADLASAVSWADN